MDDLKYKYLKNSKIGRNKAEELKMLSNAMNESEAYNAGYAGRELEDAVKGKRRGNSIFSIPGRIADKVGLWAGKRARNADFNKLVDNLLGMLLNATDPKVLLIKLFNQATIAKNIDTTKDVLLGVHSKLLEFSSGTMKGTSTLLQKVGAAGKTIGGAAVAGGKAVGNTVGKTANSVSQHIFPPMSWMKNESQNRFIKTIENAYIFLNEQDAQTQMPQNSSGGSKDLNLGSVNKNLLAQLELASKEGKIPLIIQAVENSTLFKASGGQSSTGMDTVTKNAVVISKKYGLDTITDNDTLLKEFFNKDNNKSILVKTENKLLSITNDLKEQEKYAQELVILFSNLVKLNIDKNTEKEMPVYAFLKDSFRSDFSNINSLTGIEAIIKKIVNDNYKAIEDGVEEFVEYKNLAQRTKHAKNNVTNYIKGRIREPNSQMSQKTQMILKYLLEKVA